MLGRVRYTVWERMAGPLPPDWPADCGQHRYGGGVTLTMQILYVWMIAIVLMLINPRYMCFPMPEGCWPSKPGLRFSEDRRSRADGNSGLLHLVESVLIFLNGCKHSIPVFLEDKTHGVVGAFNLVRFWPIPIIIMTAIIGQIPPEGSIPMPDWWPLLKPMGITGDMEDVMFLMLPVVAALGYSDIAITDTPAGKAAIRRWIFSHTA